MYGKVSPSMMCVTFLFDDTVRRKSHWSRRKSPSRFKLRVVLRAQFSLFFSFRPSHKFQTTITKTRQQSTSSLSKPTNNSSDPSTTTCLLLLLLPLLPPWIQFHMTIFKSSAAALLLHTARWSWPWLPTTAWPTVETFPPWCKNAKPLDPAINSVERLPIILTCAWKQEATNSTKHDWEEQTASSLFLFSQFWLGLSLLEILGRSH